ncbi:uncharacterized protein EDB91DRAFT_461015 [Suillus paluster]|uniref:uncharacterized protein n=1 Tax=Suillus paluster TaxID=48578 RepID=UPI001B8623E6|nr:uncharacterized protein EDB91DRAFT_461015 [Suillus paluster]KAG1738439.1 hypothetical protein EDB91DRAFT_461015 [Suillus paluster]
MQVIMIVRLHAMYQGSRKMLIFLIAIFLAVNISCGVMSGIALKNLSGEELILDGTYECTFYYGGGVQILIRMVWILSTIWEVLVLCLAVWIAMKHFRDLRRLGSSTGSTLGDCFTVLIESHALYFASFAVVACLQLGSLSPKITAENSMGALIYSSFLEIVEILQMFVLGPRLILSVRKYHAKLVANSDAATVMTSIAFQEREHVSAGSDV